MSQGQGITSEQSIGEVVSKTFDLYRRDFTKYLVVFLVVNTIIGVLTALVRRAFVLTPLPVNPTSQQFFNWFPGFFGTLITLVALIGIVALVFYPVAIGSAVKMASESITKGQADLGTSIRFTVSKLVWIWALSIVVGIIIFLGIIALVVPGIILGIMFSLVLPVLLIENPGVLESMGRSRRLVGNRWLKTFALWIVFGIILVIAGAVVSVMSAPFGGASGIVSGILGAFCAPLTPIALEVYYYSNVARTTIPQAVQAPMTSAAVAQAGVKFCPKCGTLLASTAAFCSKCGAPQPT